MEIIKLFTVKEWIIILLFIAFVIVAPNIELNIREKLKRRKIKLAENLSIEEKQVKIKELEVKMAKKKSFRLGCLIAELTCIISFLALVALVRVLVGFTTGILGIFQTPG